MDRRPNEPWYGYCGDCVNRYEKCSVCYRGTYYERDNRDEE